MKIQIAISRALLVPCTLGFLCASSGIVVAENLPNSNKQDTKKGTGGERMETDACANQYGVMCKCGSAGCEIRVAPRPTKTR